MAQKSRVAHESGSGCHRVSEADIHLKRDAGRREIRHELDPDSLIPLKLPDTPHPDGVRIKGEAVVRGANSTEIPEDLRDPFRLAVPSPRQVQITSRAIDLLTPDGEQKSTFQQETIRVL